MAISLAKFARSPSPLAIAPGKSLATLGVASDGSSLTRKFANFDSLSMRNLCMKKIERTRTLKVILPLVLLLAFGLVMVYDASIAEAQQLFNDKYHFVRLHAIWILIGLATVAVSSRIPTAWWQRWSHILFGGSLGLLVLVLLPGLGSQIQGAQRWLAIGPIIFQPSELVKLTSVLYLSKWLLKSRPVWNFLGISGFLFFLMILQPDMGTAIILMATAFFMYYVSGASLKILGGLGALGILGVLGLIFISPYRMRRVTTFLDPTGDLQGSSYHINQILLSLGSGGWMGLGLGRSRQKFQYLPEATTDSIFAVVGEELGFLGSSILVMIFLTLFWQLTKIVLREQNRGRQLLAAGLTGWLAFQTVINWAGMVALMPLTGVPLPFISYGGSSLLAQMISVGLLLRISLTQK